VGRIDGRIDRLEQLEGGIWRCPHCSGRIFVPEPPTPARVTDDPAVLAAEQAFVAVVEGKRMVIDGVTVHDPNPVSRAFPEAGDGG
jgi:hypothetical protein